MFILLAACSEKAEGTIENQEKKEDYTQSEENLEDDASAEQEAETNDNEAPKEEENQEEKEENNTISFEDIDLKNGVELKNAIIEGSTSIILGASENHILLQTMAEGLYLYNIKEEKTIPIANGVKHATITEDDQYVFYVKENVADDIVHYYDIQLNLDQGPLTEPHSDGGIIRNVTYLNGAFYYSYPLLENDTHVSELKVLKKYTSTFVIKPEDEKISETSRAFAANDHAFYYYSPQNKSINKVHLSGDNQELGKVEAEFDDAEVLAVNNKEEWVILDFIPPESKLVTSYGEIEDVTWVRDVQWIYDNYLLVISSGLDDKLILIDPETQEHKILSKNFSSFAAIGDSIYVQGGSKVFKYSLK